MGLVAFYKSHIRAKKINTLVEIHMYKKTRELIKRYKQPQITGEIKNVRCIKNVI